MLEQNGVEKSYSTPFNRMQGGSVFFLVMKLNRKFLNLKQIKMEIYSHWT